MPRAYPYRRSYELSASGATEQTVVGNPVAEGRVLRITNMAVWNITNNATLVKVGLVSGGRDHWLDGCATLAQYAAIGFDMDVLLYEGDAPTMKVTTGAQHDKFTLYVNGEWWHEGQAGELPV